MEQMENPNAVPANDNDSYRTFGRYLKKVRVEKGLSIEDIMDETRISKYVIQQIEAENLNNLPEDVYLKGFLKAYADAVGIDPAHVLEKYKIAQGYVDHPQGHNKKDRHNPGPGTPVKHLVTALIVISALAALGFWYLELNPKKTVTPVTNLAVPQNDAKVTEPVSETAREKAPFEKPVADDGLHLEVICIEETTLKITADGGQLQEYVLKPEDHLELKAEKMYTLLIDNTCGISLLLNNNPVTVPGKCGQTATIQLP